MATDVSMVEASTHTCQYNYVVTAHRPENVNFSLTGNFTSAEITNLIIARNSRIEIYDCTETGLQGVLDVPIYGRIAALELLEIPGMEQACLIVVTEKYQLCILSYSDGRLHTKASGPVHDLVGRPTECGIKIIVEPSCRAIGLHLYQGLLKVLPINTKGGDVLGEAFNVRLDDLMVVDIRFLHAGKGLLPLLAVLSRGHKDSKQVKTYQLRLKDQDLIDGPWQSAADEGANTIVPIPGPLGGALVLGSLQVDYITTNTVGGSRDQVPIRVTTPFIQPTVIYAFEEVDTDRYLLADATGTLQLLRLEVAADKQAVTGIALQPLGHVTVPTTMSYLGNYVVYLGSSKGDNQLIRLLKTPKPGDVYDYIEVLDEYYNLGPCIDMCVVDLDRQGQCQVVTCSGVGPQGSLRVVRSGIGLLENASIDQPGIKGAWGLRAHYTDEYDAYLVLAFVRETRVLAIDAEDELGEVDLGGFELQAETLQCGNMVDDQLLQVTPSSARLVSCSTMQCVAQWHPDSGTTVSVSAANTQQVLLVVGGSLLVCLVATKDGFQEVGRAELAYEVSCLDITPLGDASNATFAALGTWDMRCCLLSLPALQLVTEVSVGKEVIPRSVLMASYDACHYLLCGLGDGGLMNMVMDGQTGALSERKNVSLGTKPITLSTFAANGGRHIFAASDRPAVLYADKGKLLYANLNENEVYCLASFNCASFPDCIALAKPEGLTIGQIDEVQKLHVDKIPLGEQPWRIAHQPSSRTYAVLTSQGPPGSDGPGFVRLLDAQTYDTLQRYMLDVDEKPSALTSITLADDPNVYYCVGTAYAPSSDIEVQRGRLLLFLVTDRQLHLVAEKETKAEVWVVAQLQDKLLACIGSRVQLYAWTTQEGSSQRELQLLCGEAANIKALYAAVRGDSVVVGDLMRSMQLFLYKQESSQLELRASEWVSRWTSAVEFLDEDCYIGANNYNLFVVRRNSDAAADEERNQLEPVGEYHLGDFVNRFAHGSLVMRLPDSEVSALPTLLYCTASGAIGVVASLPRADFELLAKLQDALNKVIQGVGGFSHTAWRQYSDQHRSSACRGFIDGDLIEQYLELDRQHMDKVVQEMGEGVQADVLYQKVEELSRLH